LGRRIGWNHISPKGIHPPSCRFEPCEGRLLEFDKPLFDGAQYRLHTRFRVNPGEGSAQLPEMVNVPTPNQRLLKFSRQEFTAAIEIQTPDLEA